MSVESFHDGRVTLHGGDCLDVMAGMEAESVDAIVTDPPYELGFMGHAWDKIGIAFDPATWAAALRALKPGGHLVAFAAPKNVHRMVCAIEDAGFEIRDSVAYFHKGPGGPLFWTFGAGFPKSRNVSRDLDGVRCMCGVRQGSAGDSAFSCSEVLQSDVRGRCQEDGAVQEDVRSVRKGVGSEDALSSRPEQDVFASVSQCSYKQEADGENDSSADALRKLRESGLSSALSLGEEPLGILQLGVPGEARDGADLGNSCAQGAVRLDGTECGFLPDENVRLEEPSMEGRRDLSQAAGELRQCALCPLPGDVRDDGAGGRLCDGTPSGDGDVDRARVGADGMRPSSGSQPASELPRESGTVAVQSKPQDGGAWPHCGRCGKPIVPDGLGTALKPAYEPICLARKPLSEATVAANVLAHGTGALNIDGCRVGDEGGTAKAAPVKTTKTVNTFGNGLNGGGKRAIDAGRWPANVLHDGSDEVVEAFPTDIDSGSAARFFYTAKADADDRIGSKHPTVKPVDLMQWLVRLVTPPGGTVLDPFAGTGTTGEAALREGFRAVLIEREAIYRADIARRMRHAFDGEDGRKRAIVKARGQADYSAGPLFADQGCGA